jgi:putative transcriptional regulator
MGKIVITLEEYLLERGISKNKLVYGAEIQRTQLQNYCKNKVTRIDLNVLARMCSFLGCGLEDIMHYEPAE